MKKYLPYIAVVIALIVAIGVYLSMSKKSDDQISDTNTGAMDHSMMGHDTPQDSSTQSEYSVSFTSPLTDIQPNQSTKLSFKILDSSDKDVKEFAVAHEKLMHLIVVRKDLQEFQHLHPEFNKVTGEFSIDVTFPSDGPFRIFPDFTPGNNNPQKLPVTVYKDVEVGNMSKYQPKSLTVDTGIQKTSGGYNINYNFPQNLKAGQETEYSLIVEKPGETVTLQPYLGAMGHSVILKEGTLDYIHAHNMEMGAMDHQMPGAMIMFGTSFPQPGNYKLFTQFQTRGQVITSDYTVKVN